MIGELSQATFPNALTAEQREPLPDFATLVHQHQAMVYSIAHSFLRDPGAAEEIAQDVFLELHGALPALESPQHVMRWLRRVAAHRSIDSLRRYRGTLPLLDVREPAVLANVGDVLLEDRLRKLVASLPPVARMIVILRYQEGLGLEEIAAAVDVPVRSVKGRLHRAIVLLRERLERPAKAAGGHNGPKRVGKYNA